MASFTDDDSNLTFIVDGLGESRMRVNILSSADDRGETLGEDDRVSRLINLVGAVETGAVKLFGMFGIVLAYAQHISTIEWW